MGIIEQIINKAKSLSPVRSVVLPEGDEPRTMKAAAILQREGIAKPILLGSREQILCAASSEQVDLSDITIIDPALSERRADYANALFEMRRAKGLTPEGAEKLVSDPMYFGVMMVRMKDADGLVSGAVHTTGDMLRPALQIIKTKPGISVVSSSILIELKAPAPTVKNTFFLFSDCVVNPCPTAEQLAHIAISTADTARTLCDIKEPRVALLSFSTKGSASHELVTKVQEAAALAHQLDPDLLLDGELQVDAALIPETAALKAKGSPVGGNADVLIFPDLQAGNIGYKIAQRLTGASATAVLQGLAAPCNDVSRGCSVDDIVATAAITAVQSSADK